MKKIINYILIGLFVVGFSSCKKFLDINENPNSATSTTPQLVLPQAIVASASLANTFNINLADIGGQQANAGGFGGFGSVVTNEYTTSSFTGLWSSTMNVNADLKYVVDQTIDDPKLAFYSSAARILKALNFARLVDQYNDIPYTEALQGKENMTPAYDKASDVYKDLVKELNESIAAIEAGEAANQGQAGATTSIDPDTDPLFGGTMNSWKRFANTIKLRLLIKMAGVPDLNGYATGELNSINTTLGFLEEDALVNPGYSNESGKQAPIFASRGETVTGGTTQTSRIPSYWMHGFYDGNKLTDEVRGSLIYYQFPGTRSNQLGDESANVDRATGWEWYPADKGVVKGAGQSQPIMLAAESYFLQAEAAVRGYLSGSAEDLFVEGMAASFYYLFLDADGSYGGEYSQYNYVSEYIADNELSYLVNWDKTDEPEPADYNQDVTQRRIEAIITQKYIALNFVNNDEAYNEFRRTKYPYIVNGSSDPYLTFASLKSRSTRPDGLVGRILYPQFEYAQNAANAPSGITLFGSRIFWDLD